MALAATAKAYFITVARRHNFDAHAPLSDFNLPISTIAIMDQMHIAYDLFYSDFNTVMTEANESYHREAALGFAYIASCDLFGNEDITTTMTTANRTSSWGVDMSSPTAVRAQLAPELNAMVGNPTYYDDNIWRFKIDSDPMWIHGDDGTTFNEWREKFTENGFYLACMNVHPSTTID